MKTLLESIKDSLHEPQIDESILSSNKVGLSEYDIAMHEVADIIIKSGLRWGGYPIEDQSFDIQIGEKWEMEATTQVDHTPQQLKQIAIKVNREMIKKYGCNDVICYKDKNSMSPQYIIRKSKVFDAGIGLSFNWEDDTCWISGLKKLIEMVVKDI